MIETDKYDKAIIMAATVKEKQKSADTGSFSSYFEALGPLASALLCFPMCIAH